MNHALKYLMLLSLLLLIEINTYASSIRSLVGEGHEDYLETGQECKTNFECNTSCCENGKCTDIDQCKKRVTYIYISVGVIAGLFLIAVIIFFVCTVNQTRKNVSKIKEENKKKAKEFEEQLENNKKKAQEAQTGFSDKRY